MGQTRLEHRQVDLAQERLGNPGLKIEWLPGGHLTTNEQPQALAALIARFAMADQPIRHLTLRVQQAAFDPGHTSRVLCLFQGFRTLAGYAER